MKDVLSLHQAINATLAYFDILNFPLTPQELEKYLYGWSAPVEVIEEELRRMGNIGHTHGYYFLKGRSGIAEARKENARNSYKLWKKLDRFAWLLSLCPFVKMIAVCNSLAYENAKDTSDIDLFVITEKDHLWTTRFFMKAFTHIFKMRVHHDKIAGRFCLSFFVSEKAMDLKPLAYEFDLHLAYFVKTMVPILGEDTYLKFLKENDNWALPYFKKPLGPRLYKIKNKSLVNVFRVILESILIIFGRFTESFFYHLQAPKDLERKKQFQSVGSIVIKKDIFKFHEKDPRREIAEKFSNMLL